jgi:4-hydroxybenzoyl-CoA thioesterase/acyl-CoA thioester hydrolase
MEEVEQAYFRSLGLSVSMRHDGVEIGWPRVSASCQYSAPARFEDEIELQMRITKVGRKSLNYEVDFVRKGQVIARGSIASVCCTMANGAMAAATIPEGIREKLGKRMMDAE